MTKILRSTGWGLAALLLAACAPDRPAPSAAPEPPGPAPKPAPGPSGPDTKAGTIYVMSNGWHTGIVIARDDLPSGRIPEAADFAQARYLEFGWGDAEYYPAKRPTALLALRAALVPTAAVVHVAGLRREPSRIYPKAEVATLALGSSAMTRLIDHLDASFARGGEARADSTGPGLYADSRFYPATGRFHLGNTCNSWTARGLAAAGLAVDPSEAALAEDLMRQVRALDELTN